MSRWFDPTAPLPPEARVASTQRVYRRIFAYMREFWRGISLSISFMMLSSVFVALQPWPIKFLIDGVLVSSRFNFGPFGAIVSTTQHQRLMVAAVLAAAYFGVTALGAIFNASGVYVIARTALLMIHRLRSRLIGHMRSLSLSFHASQSVGDTIWRSINDARSIQDVMIFGVRTWAVLVFRLALMVGLMALLDPILTLVALAALPLLFFSIHRLTGRIQRASQESREHMSRLTSLIGQTMGAIRAVQVFGRESAEQRRFESTSLNFVRAQLRFRVSEQVLNVATAVITGLGMGLVLFVAASRVVSGAVTVGTLWIFVSYMQSLYQLMNDMMFVYAPFQDAIVGVSRVFQALEQQSDIQEAPDALEKPAFEDAIGFRDVQLAYEPERPVLRRISLEIRKGERVAIVGETGSGKTTMLNLIPRLYDVSAEAVTIDGIDVRQLKLVALRDLVSMVPQEPLLFSATVRENILYGRLDASDAEVESAARAARAEGFILELPNRYETEVGERGVKLSTGQQQRLAIARAFLKDAPVLLLDEPTSALDLRTEADFLDGLSALMEGRTVLIVAHRLSTIRSVDRIYVLAGGVIAEQGSHDQLMQRRGDYYDLYMTQFGTASEPVRP